MFHLYTLPSTACMKNVTRSCIRISHRCALDCPALPCSESRCRYLSLSTSTEDVSASPSGASAAVLDFCPRILFADHRVVLLHQSHRLRCDPAMISVPSYCCYCCSVSDMDVISLLFNCYSEYSFHALYPLLVAASSTFLTLDAWRHHEVIMIPDLPRFRRGRCWCWCRWLPSGPWFRWRCYIPSRPAWPGRTAIDARMAFVASLQQPWPCSSRLWREIPGEPSPFPWWKPHHGRRFYSSPFWSPSPWGCWTWSWQQLDKTGQVIGFMMY